jgi:hypothetical protein
VKTREMAVEKKEKGEEASLTCSSPSLTGGKSWRIESIGM